MDEPTTVEMLTTLILPAGLSFFAFLLRFSIRREKFALVTFFLDALATTIVGVLVAMLVDDYDYPTKFKWGIVTLGALMGPELLSGVFRISTIFSRSPITLTLRVVRVIRGKPMTTEEAEQLAEWEKEFINSLERDRRERERGRRDRDGDV